MVRIFEFGPFRLDEAERTLARDGVTVNLAPKTFDVLVLLAAHANRLVEKNRLLDTVWSGVHVDEAVLARAISDLRKALQQPGDPAWIETVPKFGYRFAGEVRESGPAATVAPRIAPWRRWLIPAGVLTVAGLLAIVLAWGTSHPRNPAQRLAILPFQTIGAAPQDAALGVGLADVLITRLSSLQGLLVRPISAVRRFEHGAPDLVRAARELEADSILEGTLQFAEGAVRATVRLRRASDGGAVWTDTLEVPAGRFFALEDALAEAVAGKLAVQLSPEERRELALRPEREAETHRLYSNGRYEWGKRTRGGFEQAAAYFRRAIDRDPGYARGYAGLADCLLLLGAYGHRPQLEMLPEARGYAARALELDPRLAEAHATLGLITQNLEWDWAKTERHYREAIRLAPGYATGHHWYAEFLSIQGRFEESAREFERAREIDPLSPIILADQAQLYFFQRDYGRNLGLLEKLAREHPSFELAHERLAFTYLAQGRDADAWREALRLPGCAAEDGDCRRMWTAWLPGRDPRAAAVALAGLESGATAGSVPPYAVVYGHIRQGHPDTALEWLERMEREHGVWLITAKVNPLFDPLRGQARFRAVLGRLHL